MDKPTNAQARAWAAQWRAAEPALARIRAAELAVVDLWRVADELEEALWVRVRSEPAALAPGLVEQQRLFGLATPR
jgi:hypothetical protein